MNLKPPKNARSALHYVVRFIPCFECAREDAQSSSMFRGDNYNQQCSNCEGEGYRATFIPLTRSLVERIIYEESEK